MKVHKIKSILTDDDFKTTTYCGLSSDSWSEHFSENINTKLTVSSHNTTCKSCLKSYYKAINTWK